MYVDRIGNGTLADLHTIWKTPYPVLTKYKLLCGSMKVIPFAGGNYLEQGSNNKQGYITSGYRDELIEGRKQSPHLYALAIDVAVGNIQKQIAWGSKAYKLYTRVGLYPDRGFIHCDLMPTVWIDKYSDQQKRYWICIKGKYHYASGFGDIIDMSQSLL